MSPGSVSEVDDRAGVPRRHVGYRPLPPTAHRYTATPAPGRLSKRGASAGLAYPLLAPRVFKSRIVTDIDYCLQSIHGRKDDSMMKRTLAIAGTTALILGSTMGAASAAPSDNAKAYGKTAKACVVDVLGLPSLGAAIQAGRTAHPEGKITAKTIVGVAGSHGC